MESISIANIGYKMLVPMHLFDKDAILAAALKFTKAYFIQISHFNDDNFEISIKPKSTSSQEANIMDMFRNELIEQQVKNDLQNKFGRLREIIVEHAFSPIDKKND